MIGWVVIALALLLVDGVALLVRGARGRRVDDHPICSRCGFDLFGRPESSMVCAECGADLARPHAIQHGRRVRRLGMIAAGSALLGFVFSVLLAAAWTKMSSTDWRQHAPLWYLRREIAGADAKARDAAFTQVTRRLTAGTLAQTEIDRLADEGLEAAGSGRPST
jgi:hypothetical protein